MNPFITKIIPLILAFALGIILKQLKLLRKDDAPVLLRVVLSVTLPALTILSINRAVLDADMLFIPLSAMIVVFCMWGISSVTGRLLKLPKTTFGSFLVGTMIMNTAYALPFFMARYGNEGFARASLFDMGNTFLIFTFTYFNAIKYGDNSKTDKIEWSKFLRLPPLWAMVLAFLLRGFNIPLDPISTEFLSLVGNPTTPLIMIALGLYFEPQLQHLSRALVAIFIRMGIGLALGYLLAMIFGLEGINRVVVIVTSATPIGFNTLIFANLENMDREFAATMVSISIVIALFYLPWLIYVFG